MYALHRRQFIPQGAISVVRIAFGFADLLGIMSAFWGLLIWVPQS